MTPLHTHWKKKKKIRRSAKKGEGESLRGHLIQQRQSVPKIAEISHKYFIRGHVINLLFLFDLGTWALHTNMFFFFFRFLADPYSGIFTKGLSLLLFIIVWHIQKKTPLQSLVRCPLGPVENQIQN